MITSSLSRFSYLPSESIEKIHETSLKVLEELGLEFNHPEALAVLEQSGAEVVDRENNLVRLPRGLVLEAIAKAPAEFALHARNPAHTVTIGGDHIVTAPVYGPPFVHDLDRGRRADVPGDLVKDEADVAQASGVIDGSKLAAIANDCLHMVVSNDPGLKAYLASDASPQAKAQRYLVLMTRSR